MLIAATECNDYFFGFVVVELDVIDLGPEIYVVELDTSRAFVNYWDDDVCIVGILTELVSRGRSLQVSSIDCVQRRANR